jgi:hypothetical protein
LSRSTKGDNVPQRYTPPLWGWRFVKAFFDPNVRPTIKACCQVTGIAHGTYYRHLRDPKFVTWLEWALSEHACSKPAAVKRPLYQRCLAGNLRAMKLWSKLYGQFLPSKEYTLGDDKRKKIPCAMTFALDRSKEMPAIFADYSRVSTRSAFEFFIDFGRFYPENEGAQLHTRIITTPSYAKALLETLQKSINRFEQTFGTIQGE